MGIFDTQSSRSATIQKNGLVANPKFDKKKDPNSKVDKIEQDVMSLRSFQSETETFGGPSNTPVQASASTQPIQKGTSMQSEKSQQVCKLSGDESETRELLRVMITMLLSCSERVRSLESICIYCHSGKKSSPIYQVCQEAYTLYLHKVEQAGKKNHNEGPPSIHMFHAVLESLCTMEYKTAMAPLVTALKTYYERFCNYGVEEASDAVPFCKTGKMFESSEFKLQFANQQIVTIDGVGTTTVGSLISRLLVSAGIQRKYGRAPPGWMERTLSAVLDKAK